MTPGDAIAWNSDWLWSLPIIVVNVIFHVIGLGFINSGILKLLGDIEDRRHFLLLFMLVMGVTTLSATLLHALEAGAWAGAYVALGALPDRKSAMLYSLNAMTTYGHVDEFLAPHWKLMGALEALNGMLLFGLTTAFLYGTIQRVWPIESRRWRAPRKPSPQSTKSVD